MAHYTPEELADIEDEHRVEVSAITQQRDDLLAALGECVGDMENFLREAGGGWGERSYCAGVQGRLDKANAAIAKAGGE